MNTRFTQIQPIVVDRPSLFAHRTRISANECAFRSTNTFHLTNIRFHHKKNTCVIPQTCVSPNGYPFHSTNDPFTQRTCITHPFHLATAHRWRRTNPRDTQRTRVSPN